VAFVIYSLAPRSLRQWKNTEIVNPIWVLQRKCMGLNTTRIVKQLGWRRFSRLVWNLPSFFQLFSRLIKDERVALGPKLVVLGVIAYMALPTDIIPDFFLGLGQLDDLVVLFSGLKLFLRLCPPEVVQEHLRTISAGK
jgi:uncharacterized membrane protein YkvA (DUF1232 family)